jgi:DNA-binding CsgD family transcriptional regulator
MRALNDLGRFSSIVGDVYSAALEPNGWEGLVDRLHSEMGGVKAFLFGYDAQAKLDLGQVASGFDPEKVRQFGEYYVHVNPYTAGWITAPPGVTVPSEAMVAQDVLLKTQFYAEFLRPEEDATGGGGVSLFNERGRFIAFGGHIPSAIAPRVQDDFLTLLSLLVPHLSRAFEISRALGGQALERHVSGIMGHPPAGPTEILALSADRRLIYASRGAEAHLALGTFMRIDPRGRVFFTDQKTEVACDVVANSMRRGETKTSVGTEIRDPHQSRSFSCQFLPFRGDAATASALGRVCGVNEPCLLVVLAPKGSDDPFRRRLRTVYGLTEAETEVAMAVGAGSRISEIAEVREASIWTVRNQVKALMTKVGVSRQVDLVRFLERESRAP